MLTLPPSIVLYMKSLAIKTNIYAATIYQFTIAVVMLWLTRFAFAWYNHDVCGSPDFSETLRLSMHGLRFDLCAAAYFNVLFLAMRILPFNFVYNRLYLRISNIIYCICNAIMLAINIGDIPYYRFTGARLRWSNVCNITTDSEIANIIGTYAGSYWLAFIGGAALIAITLWLATRVEIIRPAKQQHIAVGIGLFVIFGGLTFVSMRGHVAPGIPLAIADATFAVHKAPEINIVLNSPFCVLRSLNTSKSNREEVVTFFDDTELATIRSSVHNGAPTGSLKKRNYVTIIIESGGSEWIDTLCISGANPHRGLMPFLDSLVAQSTVIEHTIATGRTSVGGATSIFCGFPAFEPFYFMLSPFNKNRLDSPARLLANEGWSTAFYYGCKKGSFNIDQTAFAAGHNRVVDRQTYNNDDDYDGAWGIYDVPMAKYTINDISTLAEPFFATWFTISAHGPFNLPKDYDTSRFKHPEASPERGLEYTDIALRTFFAMAAKTSWYENTTFIITGDHGNRDFKGTIYDGEYIRNHVPFIIFTPDGSMPAQRIDNRVIGQYDIPATILALAGYDKPFVSIGQDALSAEYNGYGIFRTDGNRYGVVGTKYTIYTSPDIKTVEEVYNTASNPILENPLTDYDSVIVEDMLRFTQAFMQDYTSRLTYDHLSFENE